MVAFSKFVVTLAIVMLLTVIDGEFTRHFMANGAKELNPIADYLLYNGYRNTLNGAFILFILVVGASYSWRQQAANLLLYVYIFINSIHTLVYVYKNFI